MKYVCFAALLALFLCVAIGQTAAAPLSTKYYSLDMPSDWVVAQGPKKDREAVSVLLGQKDHKCSVNIAVFPCAPGDAEKLAQQSAKTLGGTKPTSRQGQLEFTFEKGGDKGYGIVREDPQAKLMMILLVSGSRQQAADFVFSMRSPYKNLIPHRP